MVFTLLATAAASLATAAGISLAAATFAVNFAVSMIVSRVFSSSSANQNVDNGVRQQVPPATTNSIPVVYGDAYLGGIFVDAVLSTDQKTMYYVLAISQISPFGQFFFDTSKMYWQDQVIGFDTQDPTKVISLTDGAGNVQTKISGNLYINLYKSDESGNITPMNGIQPPSSVMGGADIAFEQRWPSYGRQMNGLAFAVVKMNYNRDAGTTQMQALTFRVSHYLNGAGVARPGDVWFDYITNNKYGCAMELNIVDYSSAVALNIYSDEMITYTPYSGGMSTQPRYRINGVIDTGQNVLSNLDQIMLACDSWNQYNAAKGQWAIVINKAQIPSFNFDDSNIIGEIRVSAFDISSGINEIQAKFPSKLNRDQSDYVYLNTPQNLRYVNEPDNKYSVDFNMVNDSVQAQYLASRMLEQAREDLIVNFSTTYNGIQVDAGDVISVTNSAYGWSNKLFRVIKVSEVSLSDGNLGASLELNEYNAQVYDNQNIREFSPVPNSNLSNPNFFSNLQQPVVGNIFPTATIPHFDVACGVPATGRVTEITLFYTTFINPPSSDWFVWGSQTSTNSQPFQPSTAVIFSDINLPSNTYYFAFKVANEFGASILSPQSTNFNWSPNPTTTAVAGTFLATFSPVVLQVPRNSSGVPSFNNVITQLYGSAAGGAIEFSPAQFDSDPSFGNNTWRIGASPLSGYADIVTLGGLQMPFPTDGGTFAEWGIPQAMLATPATMSVPVRYKSSTGDVTQGATATVQFVFADQGVTGSPGQDGTISADVTLYKWSTSQPLDPNGQSTYDWLNATQSSYTGTNDWSTTIPANPNIPNVQLWAAIQPVVVVVSTQYSTINWNSNFTIKSLTANGANGADGTNGTNGQNGLQVARPTIYKWSISVPSAPSGTSTYTWATGSFTPIPNTWDTEITTAPSVGYTLWAASVTITDSATASDTEINWTLSSIVASGYAGTNGTNGTNGVNGTRTAILDVYKWSASAPTTFPVGDSTYTWSTGQFTAPPTLNGWSLTPPTAVLNQTLWIARTVYANSTTTATSTVTWNATTALPVAASGANGSDGTDGTNGTRTAFLEVYQWATTAPTTFPAGTSTYTWATGAFTAPSTPNSWSINPGAAGAGQKLYACSVRYADLLTTATTSVTWNTNVAYVVGAAGTNGTNGTDGTNGTNGTRTAILDVYKWSATQPTTSFPSGASTYTWATGQFTAPPTLNGWALTPPASVAGQTLWVARTIYADNGVTATTSVTWNATASFAAGGAGSNGTNGTDGTNGANGTRTAFLEVYRWAASTPTTFPAGTSTYTWATGAFTAPSTPNSWSVTPGPSTAGYILYACSVRYADSLTTATTDVTWNTSTAYAVGAAGTNGTNGTDGSNGQQGASARLCYSKTTLSSLANTPATITTTGASSFPPNDSWGNGTIWQAQPQTIVAGESVYQSDGIYDPITNNTVWNVPYLSNLKVGSLSAISANLGTITAGSISGTSLSVGSSPTVSTTTMTGSGAIINSDGTFALGDSATNISYNGTQMTLNGNVVATANINQNAVTTVAYGSYNGFNRWWTGNITGPFVDAFASITFSANAGDIVLLEATFDPRVNTLPPYIWDNYTYIAYLKAELDFNGAVVEETLNSSITNFNGITESSPITSLQGWVTSKVIRATATIATTGTQSLTLNGYAYGLAGGANGGSYAFQNIVLSAFIRRR